MKKSISLFAALVIVIVIAVVGSAFTTKSQKSKLLQNYVVWGIYPYQIWNPYFDPPCVSDLNCGLFEELYLSLSPLSYSGYSSLEEYRQEYNDGYLMCYENNNYVCMAYINYDFGFPEDGVVIDLLEGDYVHEYE
jgi:hypothetical protein